MIRTERVWKSLMITMALAFCFFLSACGEEKADQETISSEALLSVSEEEKESIQVLVDGEPWNKETQVAELEKSSDLMVSVYYMDEALIVLPFGEEHQVTVQQPDGSENTILMTRELVRMEASNCGNQDCVLMGDVTRENLEDRIFGGFIICLPHQIVVEVWQP